MARPPRAPAQPPWRSRSRAPARLPGLRRIAGRAPAVEQRRTETRPSIGRSCVAPICSRRGTDREGCGVDVVRAGADCTQLESEATTVPPVPSHAGNGAAGHDAAASRISAAASFARSRRIRSRRPITITSLRRRVCGYRRKTRRPTAARCRRCWSATRPACGVTTEVSGHGLLWHHCDPRVVPDVVPGYPASPGRLIFELCLEPARLSWVAGAPGRSPVAETRCGRARLRLDRSSGRPGVGRQEELRREARWSGSPEGRT